MTSRDHRGSVLIIAPHFAPETHAAVFRAHKLAKYLPDHGWKPYVLTVDTNYQYNADPGLIDDLPDEVEIIRARYIEPTVRGLRHAMGGEPRTYSKLKTGGTAEQAPASAGAVDVAATPRRLASRAYTLARVHTLSVPDVYWPWVRPAIRAGKRLIERNGIDVVLSTAMPYSAHRVGRALQRLGPAWVADFRDPIGYAAKMSSPHPHVRSRQQAIVRDTLLHANTVTTTSSSYALIYTDLFGPITRQPIRFIPTGVDETLMPEGRMANATRPYLVYVGEIMANQGEVFFAILGAALRDDARGHRLIVVGHEAINRRRLAPVLAKHHIEDRVIVVDHAPQAEVYRLLASARAGILAPGKDAYWWNLHAKLVDYVGFRKPVLAIVPDPSEARSVLQRTGLGVFLDGTPEQATRTLASFLDGELQPGKPVPDECDRFLCSSQVAAFSDVFDALVARS